jgi:hypothetical protein
MPLAPHSDIQFRSEQFAVQSGSPTHLRRRHCAPFSPCQQSFYAPSRTLKHEAPAALDILIVQLKTLLIIVRTTVLPSHFPETSVKWRPGCGLNPAFEYLQVLSIYCGVRTHRARKSAAGPIVRNSNPLNLSRKRARFETGTPGSFERTASMSYPV